MKARIILWKYKPLKDGTYPIKIKITSTVDGKTIERYRPIGAYARPDQWDDIKKLARPNHPNAQAINLKLATMMLDIQNQIIKDDDVIFEKIGGGHIISYFEKILQEIKIKHSALYYRGMNAVKNKLQDFNPNLTFERLKVSDIRAFESYLIGLGNNRTTIHHNLKRFKFITGLAVKDGIIEYSKNPFLNYKLEASQTKKTRLSYEQIQKIEALELEPGSKIWHTRNYWLFSFYCAGIRFSDLLKLKKSNIQVVNRRHRLIYTMNKTTKHRNIILPEQAVKILEHYKSSPGEFLFGMVDRLPADKFEKQIVIGRHNATANKNLKTLEKMIVSDIKLSFHSSRHSFADYAKKQGLDVHTIKELLGHDKIETTLIYMKSFYEEETDKAMNTLFK